MFIKMFSIEKKIHKKNKEHEKDKVNRKQEEEAVVFYLSITMKTKKNKKEKCINKVPKSYFPI
jgi:hypothetical protein